MPFSAGEGGAAAIAFAYDAPTGRWSCSPDMLALFAVPAGQEPTSEHLMSRVISADRGAMESRLEQHMSQPGPFSYQLRILDADQRERRLVLVGRSTGSPGTVERMSGFMVDITDSLRQGARDAVQASSEHRATIEQAKGALMSCFGLEDEAAFALLREYSSHRNLKLSRVAEQIVTGQSDQELLDYPPVERMARILQHLGPAHSVD